MGFTKVNKYRVKTYRPGYKGIDITLDPEYAKLVDLQKKGKLRTEFPDMGRGDVNNHARNFHKDNMLLDPSGKIKENLITFQVDEYLPSGERNWEGIIDVDTEIEAVAIINSLVSFGDKRVCMDTNFGLGIEDKAALLSLPKQLVDDDFSKKKKVAQ